MGIYKIENLINGKVYIGQSIDIFGRWNAHKNRMGYQDEHLYRSMRKYGIENFKFEILKECNENCLKDLEAFFIRVYCSWNSKYGYNMTFGHNGTFGERPEWLMKEYRKTVEGSKWMKKDGIQKRIKEEKQQQYLLSQGWKFGQLSQSRETIEKRKKNTPSQKGMITINKDNKEKKVYPDKINDYLQDDWKYGRSPKNAEKNKIGSKISAEKRKNKTYEEIYGDRAAEIRLNLSKGHIGKYPNRKSQTK